MNRKIVVLIFTMLFVFFSFPSTAFGDNSPGDHQNNYDELVEIAQTYRRFVSVQTSVDCDFFLVVINDAANWSRAEENAEAQLYDFAQRHASSDRKIDFIGIRYMNMNGEEVYFHRYNGSVVLPNDAETNIPSGSDASDVSPVDSSGDYQSAYNELDEIAQTYRRFVSVNANEDCSSFSVVINDAANWGRAEEIAEEQLYDFAQRNANSGNKNDVIDIHYMNMNGDEVYYHRCSGAGVQRIDESSINSAGGVNPNSNLVENSANDVSSNATSSYTLQDQSAETVGQSNDSSVSYSTNNMSTVKNGNSGIYTYRNNGTSYYVYYVIDFDEGYVYRFLDGNGEDSCEKVKIESGNLNDVVIITYHEGGTIYSNGLHFKWRNQPDHLVLEDQDHYEWDFYATDLEDALSKRDTKRIIEY